jgi:hypothetical protein
MGTGAPARVLSGVSSGGRQRLVGRQIEQELLTRGLGGLQTTLSATFGCPLTRLRSAGRARQLRRATPAGRVSEVRHA